MGLELAVTVLLTVGIAGADKEVVDGPGVVELDSVPHKEDQNEDEEVVEALAIS